MDNVIKLRGTTRDFNVWLECGIAPLDGLVLGGGETVLAAYRTARRELLAAVEEVDKRIAAVTAYDAAQKSLKDAKQTVESAEAAMKPEAEA